MPPCEGFYTNPSTEALAQAEQWKAVEIKQRDRLVNDHFGCKLTTLGGKEVQGYIWMGQDWGLGKIVIPWGWCETVVITGRFDLAKKKMAEKNKGVFGEEKKYSGLAKKLGLDEKSGFTTSLSSGNILDFDIGRNKFGFSLKEQGQEWREFYGGLGQEKLYLSAAGFAESFQETYPGFKLEPMAIGL